jgi:hypothetical protein
MIAPFGVYKKLDPEMSLRMALGARLRRARTARAFEDKEGGWTLVTCRGLAMRVTGPAAIYAWERLQNSDCTTWELAAELAKRFPDISAEQIEQDLIVFHGHLLESGFIEVLPRAPRLPPRRPPAA